MTEIVPIDTPGLGDRSYLATDGEVALVVDPQRDIDRVLATADRLGARITRVFETHIHNDYVTGGLALARVTGASYHLSAADRVAFDRVPVNDGEVVGVGPRMRIRALATPGHTFTHLSYVLESDGRTVAVFTGGSLLIGSTGRPDLLGPDHTDALAHAQYASAQRLARELPDDVEVYPTHGFGSFCSVTEAGEGASTLGQEKRANPALTSDERTYVDTLLAGLDAYPAYYAHMAPLNSAGPLAPDLSPPQPAGRAEIRRRIEAGEWVVDLRNRTVFAAGHLHGALNLGLDGNFATYLGWVLPWGAPLALLGETSEQVAEAQRELARIGIDCLSAAASPEDWAGGEPLETTRVAKFGDLARALSPESGGEPAEASRHDGVVVLDVRRRLEWAQGHVAGAVHIPVHELWGRQHEVPGGEVWVHCASGYRASIAASMLAGAGRRVVLIDDEYENAEPAGVPLADEV